MAKNPFKKQSIIDTAVNVGIGGFANVAMDSIVESFDALKDMKPSTINMIKIGLGAFAGSMLTGRWRAAADGIATVGVADLIKGYIQDSDEPKGQSGLPYGTIAGIRRAGNRAFRRTPRRVAGLQQGVMEK